MADMNKIFELCCTKGATVVIPENPKKDLVQSPSFYGATHTLTTQGIVVKLPKMDGTVKDKIRVIPFIDSASASKTQLGVQENMCSYLVDYLNRMPDVEKPLKVEDFVNLGIKQCEAYGIAPHQTLVEMKHAHMNAASIENNKDVASEPVLA